MHLKKGGIKANRAAPLGCLARAALVRRCIFGSACRMLVRRHSRHHGLDSDSHEVGGRSYVQRFEDEFRGGLFSHKVHTKAMASSGKTCSSSFAWFGYCDFPRL